MKTRIVILAFQMLFGVVLGLGGQALAGMVGLTPIIGVPVALVCWGAVCVGHDRDLHVACSARSMEIFDCMLDHGHEFKVNGNPWRKGCRIEPYSKLVIDPMHVE